MIDFTAPVTPIAKGRGRASLRRKGSKVVVRVTTPQKTRAAENILAAHARLALRDVAHLLPLAGALDVEFYFAMPLPKRGRKDGDACTKKPDLDNLVKLAADALNGIVWVDDSQIVKLTAAKWYGAEPSTRVVVRVLPP